MENKEAKILSGRRVRKRYKEEKGGVRVKP